MNTGVISIRYAKALYAYAKMRNMHVAVYENMRQLKDALRKIKELHLMLKDPALSMPAKVEIICSAVQDVSPVFKQFAELVVKNEREDMLLYIAYAYIGIYRKDNRVVAMKITTATPMPDSLLNKIENIIEARDNMNVEIRNVIDDSVIGGFVCEANSVRLDASVRCQLGEIRKKMVKSNKKIV